MYPIRLSALDYVITWKCYTNLYWVIVDFNQVKCINWKAMLYLSMYVDILINISDCQLDTSEYCCQQS